ncbi:MAG: UbiD family decarboxylase, partial [candidate division WOR-3 bacterium]
MFRDLHEYVEALEKRGDLKRIKVEVDPELEITEIADRIISRGGPALLFEKVKGSQIPLVINLFGTMERLLFSLGVNTPEEIVGRIKELIEPEIPVTILEKIKALPKLKKLSDYMPKIVSKGKCQEIVLKEEEVDLFKLPIMKCWPLDGGRYITLPLVFTKDPETGKQNCGMYRMQVFDSKTTGMHWHVHKDGARHFKKAEEMGQDLPVAVAIGCDPATIYSATCPLPPDVDEMLFAGFLRESPVEMVRAKTVD